MLYMLPRSREHNSRKGLRMELIESTRMRVCISKTNKQRGPAEVDGERTPIANHSIR